MYPDVVNVQPRFNFSDEINKVIFNLQSCPGHAGEKEMTEQTDFRAKHPSQNNGLHLGRSEVLQSSRQYRRAQSKEHHTIGRLAERGVERGRSSLKGRESDIVNQTIRQWNRFKIIVNQTIRQWNRFKINDGKPSMGISKRI